MAVVFSNNATTVLSSNITNSATSIAVQDGSVFPTLSGTDYFYATLQDPGNTKREIVKVTARSGNTLTVTRAVDGSSASAFSANDAFELRLNAAALNDAVNSGTADLELNSFTGDGSEVDFTLSMEALEANTLVYIDGVYQNKTAYSISGYVLTFSAAPDNGAAIEVTTATVAPIQESTDFLLNQFTGDGSDTTFSLSSSPEENQTTVFISGVYQSKSNYSISGTTLTFSTAPPASSSIEVMVARTVVYGIGTPSNDTVSTAKIVDGAVTPAKLSLTYATETYVGTAVSNLVDSSPAALDTLNELAAALGDDPNFATTVTNSIALKAPLASPSFTGNVDTSGLLKVGTNDTEYANNYLRFKPAGAAYIDHNTVGQAINFRLSNASSLDKTVMTLTSAGNMGIGTSSPNSYTGQTTLNINSAGVARLDLDINNTMQGYLLAESGYTGLFTPSGSNSLRFGTNNTERMRIDSAGRVGIGTASPNTGYALDVSGAIPAVMTSTSTATTPMYGGLGVKRETNTNGNGTGIGFILEDAGDVETEYAYIGGIIESNTAGSEDGGLVIATTLNNVRTQRMRIDSAGNVLVGKTVNDLTTDGIVLRGSGELFVTRANDVAAFNRRSSDGNIVTFRKDGTSVGSIGTYSGDLTIGNGSTVGLIFEQTGSDRISPWNLTTNATRDGEIDLGDSNQRFKDLYLSGGVYLGGTGVANRLDDYEEGTWTPTYDGSTSASGVTYSVRSGSYTKIGNTVTVSCNCVLSNKGTVVGVSRISGLPFAGNNSPAFHVISPMFGNLSLAGDGTEQGTGVQYATNSFVYLFYTNIGGGLTQMTPTHINNNSDFHFSLTYMTNS